MGDSGGPFSSSGNGGSGGYNSSFGNNNDASGGMDSAGGSNSKRLGSLVRQLSIDQFENEARRIGTPEFGNGGGTNSPGHANGGTPQQFARGTTSLEFRPRAGAQNRLVCIAEPNLVGSATEQGIFHERGAN